MPPRKAIAPLKRSYVPPTVRILEDPTLEELLVMMELEHRANERFPIDDQGRSYHEA